VSTATTVVEREHGAGQGLLRQHRVVVSLMRNAVRTALTHCAIGVDKYDYHLGVGLGR
jgi:hypothetical protein